MMSDAEILAAYDDFAESFKNETEDSERADFIRDSLCRRFPLYVAVAQEDTTRQTLFNRLAQLIEHVGSLDMEGVDANQAEPNANDAELLADAFAKAARPGYVPDGFARNLRKMAMHRFTFADEQEDWAVSLAIDRSAAAMSDLADYVEPLEKASAADTPQETQRDISVKRPWKLKRPLSGGPSEG
jgi:hypothetical protein